jgi:hypothetical protein
VRTYFRVVSIVSLLALLFGSQLCMLVDCAPKAGRAQHSCCAAAASRAAKSSRTPAHDCGRPCCIAVALPHTPELDRPAAPDAHATVALLAVTLSWLDAPVVSATHERPGDTASPPAWPPRCAAGTRAPPLT